MIFLKKWGNNLNPVKMNTSLPKLKKTQTLNLNKLLLVIFIHNYYRFI
jgi:hypothetical protein